MERPLVSLLTQNKSRQEILFKKERTIPQSNKEKLLKNIPLGELN